MEADFEEGVVFTILLTVESGEPDVVVEGLDASAGSCASEFQLMHLYKGY